MALDLLSLASVRSFAAEWERQQRPLHVLVNNAGVLLLGGLLYIHCYFYKSLLLLVSSILYILILYPS